MKALIRGRILSFNREPLSIDDVESYAYLEDGVLLIEEQKIFDVRPGITDLSSVKVDGLQQIVGY